MHNSICSPFQGKSPDQQDEQNNVWEYCSEVNNLKERKIKI